MTKLPHFFSSLSLLGCILLAAIAAFPAMAKDQSSKTWKSSTAAHLRSAPSGQSPVVTSVPRGAELPSFQPCARGWCAVEYKGFRGWIYDAFLIEMQTNVAPVVPSAQPVSKASLQKPSPAPVAKQAPPTSSRVIGLGVEERLPVRESPLDTARVVGALLPASNNVARLETCRRQWCLIEHNDVRGYVQSRFLARSEGVPSPKYGVEGESSLKVFAFGGSDAEVVGEIPFYASGIVPIGDCDREWCHIRYLGLVGFVDTRLLRPETSPQG